MSELFILGSDLRTPVPAESAEQWARWHRENNQSSIVKSETVIIGRAAYLIETKFWGSELNLARILNPRAPHHLFRSTAFHAGGPSARNQSILIQMQGAGTWEEALQQHRSVLEQVEQRSMGVTAAVPEDVCVLQT